MTQQPSPSFETWDPPALKLFVENKDQILNLVAREGRERTWNHLANTNLIAGPRAYDPDAMEFLLFVFERSRSANAENFQDLWVLFEMQKMRKPLEAGFFVEFGAADGLANSNTLILERACNWQGILAEPNPCWHEGLRKNRRCKTDLRCVWSTSGETLDFVSPTRMPQLATIDRFRNFNSYIESHDPQTFQVTTVSISDLLAQHGCPKDFAYMSVDTEGSEFQILSSLDFQRWRPSLLTVEHNYEKTMIRELREFLQGKNYRRRFTMFSRHEDWWVTPP